MAPRSRDAGGGFFCEEIRGANPRRWTGGYAHSAGHPRIDLFRIKDHWLRLLRAATQVGRPMCPPVTGRIPG